VWYISDIGVVRKDSVTIGSTNVEFSTGSISKILSLLQTRFDVEFSSGSIYQICERERERDRNARYDVSQLYQV